MQKKNGIPMLVHIHASKVETHETEYLLLFARLFFFKYTFDFNYTRFNFGM